MKTKRLITFSVFTLILLFITVTSASAKEIFISASGSDSANGLTEATSVASFSRAYSLLGKSGGDITVVDSATYSAAPSHSGTVTVKGKNASVTLSLPSEIILAGNTTFKTLTLSGSSSIYASGKTLLIDSDVTSDSRLNVYGGKKKCGSYGQHKHNPSRRSVQHGLRRRILGCCQRQHERHLRRKRQPLRYPDRFGLSV